MPWDRAAPWVRAEPWSHPATVGTRTPARRTLIVPAEPRVLEVTR